MYENSQAWMPAVHARLWRGLSYKKIMYTSMYTGSHMYTKHRCTLITFFSLGEKPPLLDFKTMSLPHKHTLTYITMPLNYGDLDLGHQLYNECLQKRDK